MKEKEWKFPGLTIKESVELKRLLIEGVDRERIRSLMLKSMCWMEEKEYTSK